MPGDTLRRLELDNGEGSCVIHGDSKTNAISTIGVQDRKIHEGCYFFRRSFVNITGTGKSYFLLQTPEAPTTVHTYFDASVDGDFDIKVYEGGTISSTETPLPVFNADRSSSRTPSASLYADAGITATGTLFWESSLNTTIFTSAQVGEFAYEIVLKPDEDYILEVTHNDTGTDVLNYNLHFYEVNC